eukprot:2242712-Pleurochrysis_carterae.AAC.2
MQKQGEAFSAKDLSPNGAQANYSLVVYLATHAYSESADSPCSASHELWRTSDCVRMYSPGVKTCMDAQITRCISEAMTWGPRHKAMMNHGSYGSC